MKKKMKVIFLSILILSACVQKNIVDDTSFVNNSHSELIPLLLSRDDFDSNWKLGFGEVVQHLGSANDIIADEYARYFLATTYLPNSSYFTFSHEIYLHINTEIDINNFLSFEGSGYQWTPSKDLDFSTQCIKYSDSNKQSCVVVEETDFLTSVLMLTVSSGLSEEQIYDAVTPIVEIIETKLQRYSNNK